MSEVGVQPPQSRAMEDRGRPRLDLDPGPRSAARLTLRDVVIALFYYRRVLFLAFLIPVVLGLGAAVTAKPIYGSEEKLLVLLGSEYIYQPEVGQAGTGTTLDRNQIMQSELEILQSQILRVAVLRKIGLHRIYPDLARAPAAVDVTPAQAATRSAIEPAPPSDTESEGAERLRRGLAISIVPQTNVIQLAFRTTDRAMSAVVLNTLVALYFERRDQVLRRPRAEASDDQDREAERRLREAEDALTRFSDAHQIASFDEQLSRLLDQQAATSSDQTRNDQLVNVLKAQGTRLRLQIAGVSPSTELYAETERAPTAAGSADDLVRLESDLRSLSSRYQPGAPQLEELQNRVARARVDAARGRQLEAKGTRRGQNPEWLAVRTHLEQVDVEEQGALARQVELHRSLGAINARVAELNGAGTEYRDLRRKRDVLAETLRVYTHNREEARLSETLERGRLNNIRIVQPAMPPVTGSAQRSVLLAGGVVMGCVLAAGLLIVLNAFRQTMLTAEETERVLRRPVLFAVSLGLPPKAPRAPPPAGLSAFRSRTRVAA